MVDSTAVLRDTLMAALRDTRMDVSMVESSAVLSASMRADMMDP